jgi:hypothetical protein
VVDVNHDVHLLECMTFVIDSSFYNSLLQPCLDEQLGIWFWLQVLHYRAQMALGQEIPLMAVVIQRMISPLAAGVLFTLDPLTGNDRRMVVEAVHGLGEGVVCGEISPHHYEVSQPSFLAGM